MKFDVVIGNPPYQDGTKDGGQNKIYNQFSEIAYKISKRCVAFITPDSILKKSKRSSIYSKTGLKLVNFNTGQFFDVGVNICYWIIDKLYDDKVEIVEKNNIRFQEPMQPIYDTKETDKAFIDIYMKLKELTDTPNKRMFSQNNAGPNRRMFSQNCVSTTTGRSFTQSEEFKYPVYKIEKNKEKLVQYNKPKPHFFGLKKVILPLTKTLNENSIFVSEMDFDVGYVCIAIDNENQLENIKSFILSDYFIEHTKKWKIIDGYGFNYAIKYLPPFDINKKWSSNEVKNFIEETVK